MSKSTGLASISAGSSDLFKIDPRKLKVQPNWNSRDFNDPENAQWVEDLCANIIEVGGVKQPVTVKWIAGEAFIRDGECRHRACMLAISRGHNIVTIPVRAEDRYANEADELVNQRLRNGAKPFSIFEDARHFKRLLEAGMTEEKIALKCAMSKTRVVQILEYNMMPEAAKKAVIAGEISASLAMSTVKEFGTEAEKKLAEGIKAAKGKKVKPGDINGAKVSIKVAVKEAFEYADVDDSDDEVIVVKFPADKWNVLREILKL